MKRRSACVALLVLFVAVSFPQTTQQAEKALVQGFEAYRNEDWTSALFFLRQAVATPAISTDETWYMLIMSEVYAGEYAAANADCERFIKQFSFSQYMPYIQYQKGRCLHYLSQNETAIIVLSDFCHQNPTNPLYASALYWIAEAFFAEYNYESARALYERIVVDFPDDAKVGAAQYRLDSIDQRGREEKLLYLLKVTGEENLAAREEYERQLRQYEAEDRLGLRQQLSASEARVAALERELAAARAENAALAAEKTAAALSPALSPTAAEPAEYAAPGVHDTMAPVVAPVAPVVKENDSEVEALKRKARQLQYLLDEQRAMEYTQ